MNWLRALLGFSALLVAGCAAYFSVTGLGILFSGASGAVMIMAASLELAKLVSATYLKQRWNEINGINKWYLTSAVIILMIITSAGIFGFLSNAFQQQNIKLQQVEREINVWENKIKSDSQQITLLTTQLNNLQTNQGKIIDGSKVNNRLLRSIDNRDRQTQKIQDKINSLQDSSVIYNSKINDIKNKNISLEREIGGFRFVAESFNFELNTVVKFFIILIVFVFDPLAVAMIIAFNQLLLIPDKKNRKKYMVNEQSEDLLNDEKPKLTDDDLEKTDDIQPKRLKTNDDIITKNNDHYINENTVNDDEYVPTDDEIKINQQKLDENVLLEKTNEYDNQHDLTLETKEKKVLVEEKTENDDIDEVVEEKTENDDVDEIVEEKIFNDIPKLTILHTPNTEKKN